MRITILTVSDRASRGEYEDFGGPAVQSWLSAVVVSPCDYVRRIVPDGLESVQGALIELCDGDRSGLVLTTGGTGHAVRDETPEAMEQVFSKELPGLRELMHRASLARVATAILSRQTAGIRGGSLIVNLPGKPSAIAICVAAVFPAVPYCFELIGAGRIDLSAEFDVTGRAVQVARFRSIISRREDHRFALQGKCMHFAADMPADSGSVRARQVEGSRQCTH